MVILWSKGALAELRKLYNYIAIDSPQNAQMIVDAIVNTSSEIQKNPEKHPLDKLKIDNDGSWRAFEKHHYRVSYQVSKDEILIARIRHTSRLPRSF